MTDGFNFNTYLQDYAWDLYKAKKRRAEYDMYANVIGKVGGVVGGVVTSGSFDIGAISTGIGGIISTYGGYAGFDPYLDPRLAPYLSGTAPGSPGITPTPPGVTAAPAAGGGGFVIAAALVIIAIIALV